MNEVGLDPGIDHMLAMECFDDAKSEGAVVCWTPCTQSKAQLSNSPNSHTFLLKGLCPRF